jgi:hypothetical protein
MAKSVKQVEDERDLCLNRINHYFQQMEGAKMYPEERSFKLSRIEDYVVQLMKLPTAKTQERMDLQNDMCDRVEAFFTAELEDNHRGCSMLQDMRRRHRNRLRTQRKKVVRTGPVAKGYVKGEGPTFGSKMPVAGPSSACTGEFISTKAS